MTAIMSLLGSVTSLFGLAVFVRVVLTWFDNRALDGPARILGRVTDPYLNWFQRFELLKTPGFDFSPLLAMAALSFAQNVFFGFARAGRVGLGILLSVALSSVWSIASFLFFICVVILALYLAATTVAKDSIMPFWGTVRILGEPLLDRIQRLLGRERFVSRKNALIGAIALLMIANIGGSIVIGIISSLFAKLPI